MNNYVKKYCDIPIYIHGGIMHTYIYEFDIAAALLIAALILILIHEKADRTLIFALVFVLLS